MIPLTFFIASAAFFAFYNEWRERRFGHRNFWFLGLLFIIAFQQILIGVRFGYGQEWLGNIQPITAAMLPPLAYLSFKRPRFEIKTLVHALPVIIMLFALFMFRGAIDSLLAVNNLFYALILILLGIAGNDAFAWVKIGQILFVQRLFYLVCAILIISGLIDMFIIYDSWVSNGNNIGNIVGWASLTGLVAVVVVVMIMMGRYRNKKENRKDIDKISQKNIFDQLQTLMVKERLFLDPDINLNRIARRMVLPVREVSRAINGQTSQNVSQYINKLRVKEACRLLRETNLQVTAVVFESGFNTKSNFNREFTRITRKTPSDWRSANASPSGITNTK